MREKKCTYIPRLSFDPDREREYGFQIHPKKGPEDNRLKQGQTVHKTVIDREREREMQTDKNTNKQTGKNIQKCKQENTKTKLIGDSEL